LDPVARRLVVEAMVQLTRRSDRTIFFSSHQLADVERVADYVAVLDHSVLRACCSLETFRNSVQEVAVRFKGAPPPLPEIPGLLQVVRKADELRLTCVRYDGKTEQALRALSPLHIELVPLSLEDAFIGYLGDRGEKSLVFSETEARS
jgi:ABC-2 type transport system ATP-binding protein